MIMVFQNPFIFRMHWFIWFKLFFVWFPCPFIILIHNYVHRNRLRLPRFLNFREIIHSKVVQIVWSITQDGNGEITQEISQPIGNLQTHDYQFSGSRHGTFNVGNQLIQTLSRVINNGLWRSTLNQGSTTVDSKYSGLFCSIPNERNTPNNVKIDGHVLLTFL